MTSLLSVEQDKILTYLKDKNINAQLQKETNQICIVFKLGEKEYPLFIRIFEGGELLQLLAFLPCNIKEKTAGDTARLLHLLNKEIDMPGFGMDEAASVVFYRQMIPAKDKKVDKTLFDAYLHAAQVVCQSFAPVIAAVAYGAATFQEVVQKSKEHGHQSITQSHLQRS